LGLYRESDAIERDEALNANPVFPRLVPELSTLDVQGPPSRNLAGVNSRKRLQRRKWGSVCVLQGESRGRKNCRCSADHATRAPAQTR
jgi:hypothetical protein